MSDEIIWKEWKSTPSPDNNKKLLAALKPRIEYAVKKYNTSGVPESVLRTQAKKLALVQAKTFDPGRGANLHTHVAHGLRKMTDFVEDEKNTVRIPNYMRNQVPVFLQSRDELRDRLDREPNIEEISDHMKIGKNLASKLEKAIQRKELFGDKSQFDVGGAHYRTDEEETINMYYYDIKDPKEKLVFEHTFGLFGKTRLKPKDIARVSKLHEQKVRRMQAKFAKTIQSYTTGR